MSEWFAIAALYLWLCGSFLLFYYFSRLIRQVLVSLEAVTNSFSRLAESTLQCSNQLTETVDAVTQNAQSITRGLAEEALQAFNPLIDDQDNVAPKVKVE